MSVTVRYCTICLVAVLALTAPKAAICAEGMWVPSAGSSPYLFDSLRSAGLQLAADEVFTGNPSSLSSAVFQLSTGCTGSIVSQDGLSLTNYHCLLRFIPALAGTDSLIKNGFAAHAPEQEPRLEGLSAEITHQIIDLTDSISAQLAGAETFLLKKKRADSICLSLEKQYSQSTGLIARIKPSLHLTQFHLYLLESFSDIRLAFLPPEYVDLGHVADNWQWPRHSADFAFIRIYKNGKAYHSDAYIPVAQSYPAENDFAMLLGFPTESDNHLSSAGLACLTDSIIPVRNTCLKTKAQIFGRASNKDQALRNVYLGKLYNAQNSATKYDGAYRMLKRYRAHAGRYELEQQLASEDPVAGGILTELYAQERALSSLEKQSNLLLNSVFGSDLFIAAMKLRKLSSPTADFAKTQATTLQQVVAIFGGADVSTEQELATALFVYYIENADKTLLPSRLAWLDKQAAMHYFEDILKKSVLTDLQKTTKFVTNYKQGESNPLDSDPLFVLANDIYSSYLTLLRPEISAHASAVDSLYYEYFQRLGAITNTSQYPDADATLRLSYGQLRATLPEDGVRYAWRSTKQGLEEKYRQDSLSYPFPAIFRAFVADKLSGDQTICFTTTCHTSGGNSGSPVLNARGEMIGLNFDRIWQATMSDYYYSEEICRNIAVDMRYIMLLLGEYFAASEIASEIYCAGAE